VRAVEVDRFYSLVRAADGPDGRHVF
jgi:hypothetical protein